MAKGKDYILSVQTLFDFLCGYFGLDWNEIMNRQRVEGTLGAIRVQHSMFDMYKHIQAGDGYLAWEQGVGILKTIIKNGMNGKQPKIYGNVLNFCMMQPGLWIHMNRYAPVTGRTGWRNCVPCVC